MLGTNAGELRRLRAHERVHVRQCERWTPLFLPAYEVARAWQWLRGRDAYRGNPFEVEARRLGGGGAGVDQARQPIRAPLGRDRDCQVRQPPSLKHASIR